MALGNALQGHETHVVAVARVVLARIAEADEELHATSIAPTDPVPARTCRRLALILLLAALGRSSRRLGSVLASRGLATGSSSLGIGRSRSGGCAGGGRGSLGGRSTRRAGCGFLVGPVTADGGNGEVAVLDGRLHPRRKSDCRDVQRAPDIKALKAELEDLGNGIGRAQHL